MGDAMRWLGGVSAAAWLLVLGFVAGCGRVPAFPVQLVAADTRLLSFDVDGDGREDYWQDVGDDGCKTALRFDDDGDGEPNGTVRLDQPLPADGLHVVIVLDGVPFEVISDLYDWGHFRLLRRPSRLISVFPALTDVALARAFGAGPCLGYEARYYDSERNRVSDGNDVYLSGGNEPWVRLVDYRCGTNWDALAYLNPAAVWRHEMDGFVRTIAAAKAGHVRLYSVATAGLGTRGGRGAIIAYLETIDALCEQVTHQRRGRVRFTLLADHGHGLTPCRRISFRRALEAAGLRVGKSIRDDADVVMPTYGLVTCLAVHTRSPQRVADVLLGEQGVDLVMYRGAVSEPPGIIVRSRAGQAGIGRVGDRYVYEPVSGDPLKLRPTLDRLQAEGRVAGDGSVADRDWFDATAKHEYPDPLHRIWCAFEPGSLVENPAGLLVSLEEGYACGSKFFSALIPVKSTHGALSGGSSTTFIMSNAISLPSALRVDDVAGVLGRAPAPAAEPVPAAARAETHP